MDSTQSDSSAPASAQQGDLKEQLKVLHEMLGTDVTDVVNEAYQFGSNFAPDAERVLKYLSSMASKLTLALMQAQKSKDSLSADERADFEKIQSLTSILGNLQDSLNTIITRVREVNALNSTLVEDLTKLGEQIMDSQEQFRAIRESINVYGLLSRNPELLSLFNSKPAEHPNP